MTHPRELRVEPGSPPHLEGRDPGARIGAPGKHEGLARLAELVERLGVLHNRLYAEAVDRAGRPRAERDRHAGVRGF